MIYSNGNQSNDMEYANADSFAIAFEKAWKKFSTEQESLSKSKEARLNMVMLSLADHPFSKKNPKGAKAVALFRLRLLKLD